MRFRLGNVPQGTDVPAEAEGWHRIHSPASRPGYLLAVSTGFLSFVVLCGAASIVSALVGLASGQEAPASTSPLAGVIWALLLYIPVHELLHAVWHPRAGLSDRTVFVVWPARLNFGVYYDGCMSRGHWLRMRLAPFLFLSVAPALILAGLRTQPAPVAVTAFFEALILVNCIGSGGDIVAAVWVARQVPRNAHICFAGGRAYWRN